MRLFIFSSTQWAFGQLHNGLSAELRKRGWEVSIRDWSRSYPTADVATEAAEADIVMTIADGAPSLASYGIPRDKITIVAHAEADIQSLIKAEGIEATKAYARYGVVGDSLACSSLAMGVARIPTVLRVGVEFEKYVRPIAPKLTTVGYAARFTRLTNSGVEQKRGWLAKAIAEEAGLAFKTTENTPMEAMPDFYASVDAYIFPSLMEASPLPPLEAAAAGRLLIGTPAGHFPRLAYEGLGILGPLNEGAFRKFAVEKLLYYKTPAIYRRKCEAIQNAAQGRDWSKVADDWVEFFAEAPYR